MNVNLSSRELLDTYNAVLSGDPDTAWTLFTYAGGTNDLKVQASGAGGLEDVADEFRDGRMQYAFIRVTDPNSSLPKFIQLNWCGPGVPVSRKGLFHAHSAAVARFFDKAHLVVNARGEEDVEPEAILKRLADAGGAKYSVQQQQQQPVKTERIAPVGSSYTPVGKVDMTALKAGKPAASAPPARTQGSYTPPAPGTSFAKPSSAAAAAPAPGRAFNPPPPARKEPAVVLPQAAARDDDDDGKADDNNDDETWGDEPPPAPSRAPAAARPAPAQQQQQQQRPAGSFYRAPEVKRAPAPVKAEAKVPEKPKEEDRIGKVGTAYTPVSLPKPKKLVNPFAAQQAAAASSSPTPSPGTTPGGGAKLTWSQRQALARARDAEDDARSKAASAAASPAPARPLGGVSAAAVGAGVGSAIAGEGQGDAGAGAEEEAEPEGVEPAAPAPPPLAARPLPPARAPANVSLVDDGADAEDEDAEFEPPAPAPPPARSAIVPNAPPAFPSDDEEFEDPAPAPPPVRRVVPNAPPAFPPSDEEEEEEEEAFAEPDPTPAPAPPQRSVVPNAPPAFPDDEDFEEPEPTPAPRAPSPVPAPEPPAAAAAAAAPPTPARGGSAGVRARVLFDYEKAEDNELALVEGDVLHDVDMIDEGWWSATNDRGESGLFPANYVEQIADDDEPAAAAAPPAPPRAPSPEPEPETAAEAEAEVAPAAGVENDEEGGLVATAMYDYDAAESNELSFAEGARIRAIVKASDDWWEGTGPDGSRGLFPANYVEVQE